MFKGIELTRGNKRIKNRNAYALNQSLNILQSGQTSKNDLSDAQRLQSS